MYPHLRNYQCRITPYEIWIWCRSTSYVIIKVTQSCDQHAIPCSPVPFDYNYLLCYCDLPRDRESNCSPETETHIVILMVLTHRQKFFFLPTQRQRPNYIFLFQAWWHFCWIIIVRVTFGASVLLALFCFVDSYWRYPVCLHMGVQFWKWGVLWWSFFFLKKWMWFSINNLLLWFLFETSSMCAHTVRKDVTASQCMPVCGCIAHWHWPLPEQAGVIIE